MALIQVTTTLAIDERDIDERFIRASRPGGQNVNKVSTAVEARNREAAREKRLEIKKLRGRVKAQRRTRPEET